MTTGSLKQNPCTASVAASFNHGPKVNLTYDLSNRVTNLAHNGWSEDYLYSPDNRRIWRSAGQTFCSASVDNDQGLSWNPGTGAQSQYILYSPAGQKLGVYCLNFSPSGQYNVWTASEENVYWGSRLVAKRIGVSAMGHFITDRLHSKGDGSAFYPYGESKTGAAGDDREQFATYTRDQSSGLDYADQRWYSSRLGRFTNPDPIQAGNAMLLTANWNKFTYVSGNPVNKNDPRGICSPQDVPPCYSIDGIDNPETPGGLQGGRLAVGGEDGMFEVAVGDGEGSPGLAAVGAAPDPPSLPNPSRNWTEANRALESTREFLSGISYSALSSDCKSALSSIGSQFTGNPLSGESLLAQVKAASERAQFHDIKKSQHYYADLYKNTLAYSVVLAQYGSMTIQTHFASYPGEHVLSQLLGHNIYFANEAVSRTSTARNSSLLFHELIHNLGRDDADLKRALGIPIDWNSSWISYRLFERCFK